MYGSSVLEIPTPSRSFPASTFSWTRILQLPPTNLTTATKAQIATRPQLGMIARPEGSVVPEMVIQPTYDSRNQSR
jgi:hypothetical protein